MLRWNGAKDNLLAAARLLRASACEEDEPLGVKPVSAYHENRGTLETGRSWNHRVIETLKVHLWICVDEATKFTVGHLWAEGQDAGKIPGNRAVLCCAELSCAVRCGAVRCGAVRCGAVRCGAVRCGAVRCGVVWCGVVSCGVVWCGVVSCRAVPCRVVSCRAVQCSVRGVVWSSAVCCCAVRCGVVWCSGVEWTVV